jgi:hypothetical protein
VRADGVDTPDFKPNCQTALLCSVSKLTEHGHFDLKSPSFCGISSPASSVVNLRWSMTPVVDELKKLRIYSISRLSLLCVVTLVSVLISECRLFETERTSMLIKLMTNSVRAAGSGTAVIA